MSAGLSFIWKITILHPVAGVYPAITGKTRTVLVWLFPWPALIVWLWIGGIVVTGFAGMLFAVSALLVFFWRLSKAYPDWGLSDHQQ